VSDPFLSLLIESLVAVLLVLTIGYCMVLNRRLKRLRADESSLRATIAELVTATTVAERAIEGLRKAVSESDATLGERLRTAERVSSELERDLQRGEDVISRIHQIAVAAKDPRAAPKVAPTVAPPVASKLGPAPVMTERKQPGAVSDAIAAAKAIATRTRERTGRAA
jgi:hypothetical protein